MSETDEEFVADMEWLKPDTAFPRDAEFLDYIRSFVDESRLSRAAVDRLFDLARRGAAMQKLTDAANALIAFHNAPQEMRRPDVHHMLLVKLCRALPPPPAGETE